MPLINVIAYFSILAPLAALEQLLLLLKLVDTQVKAAATNQMMNAPSITRISLQKEGISYLACSPQLRIPPIKGKKGRNECSFAQIDI